MVATKRLVTDEHVELLKLVEGADSVELKLTVPAMSGPNAVRALGIEPLEAQLRQVFFFDTPSLDLNQAGVVVRARRDQGRGDDSVIKLRPVVPADLPAELRTSPNLVVEVDAMPGGYVCSASMKGTPVRSVRENLERAAGSPSCSPRNSAASSSATPQPGSIWTG